LRLPWEIQWLVLQQLPCRYQKMLLFGKTRKHCDLFEAVKNKKYACIQDSVHTLVYLQVEHHDPKRKKTLFKGVYDEKYVFHLWECESTKRVQILLDHYEQKVQQWKSQYMFKHYFMAQCKKDCYKKISCQYHCLACGKRFCPFFVDLVSCILCKRAHPLCDSRAIKFI